MNDLQNNKEYNYQIDFLKFLFMLIIVGLHSECILGQRIIWLSGVLAVEFFFIVSGYLMTKKAEFLIERFNDKKESLKIGQETIKFLFKKYMLIFPTLFYSILVCVAIRFYFGDKDLMNNLIYSIWELFCGQMFGFTAYYSTGVEWYLSAMFASMWIIYPLYLKNRDIVSNIIAPLLSLVILGWISLTYGNIGDNPGSWNGFYFKGMIRGIADISLGVICYKIASRISNIKFNVYGRMLVSLTEIICYGLSILYMMGHNSSAQDTIIIILLLLGISITFSRQSYVCNLFKSKVWKLCSKFSSTLFFCHYTWAIVMSGKMIHYPFLNRFIVYIILSFLTTIAVIILVKLDSILINKLKTYRIKEFFVMNYK